MSTALNKAIYARLTGTETPSLTGDALAAQSTLVTLLGTIQLSPTVTKKAVHFGNKSRVVAYPAITYRPTAGSADKRFRVQTGVMDDVVYDFEIWENGDNATAITDIEEQIQLLLDRRRNVNGGVGLPLSSGTLFNSEEFTPLQLLYDDKLNAWAGLVRYVFKECRF
jgi:hypothetical protein